MKNLFESFKIITLKKINLKTIWSFFINVILLFEKHKVKTSKKLIDYLDCNNFLICDKYVNCFTEKQTQLLLLFHVLFLFFKSNINFIFFCRKKLLEFNFSYMSFTWLVLPKSWRSWKNSISSLLEHVSANIIYIYIYIYIYII